MSVVAYGSRSGKTHRIEGLVAGLVGAVAASQWLGRTAGSTRSERHRRLPGDELVPRPTVRTNHAITIPAPPDRVWPWLVQVGWHRAGWYTPYWVGRLLFPANWPSSARLVPDLQRPLQVGDHIPEGPPGTAWFVVEQVEQGHLLVLHSTTHMPASWRARRAPPSTGRGRSRWRTAATSGRACWYGPVPGPRPGGSRACTSPRSSPPTISWRRECSRASADGSAQPSKEHTNEPRGTISDCPSAGRAWQGRPRGG
jgi:hypothetical protein